MIVFILQYIGEAITMISDHFMISRDIASIILFTITVPFILYSFYKVVKFLLKLIYCVYMIIILIVGHIFNMKSLVFYRTGIVQTSQMYMNKGATTKHKVIERKIIADNEIKDIKRHGHDYIDKTVASRKTGGTSGVNIKMGRYYFPFAIYDFKTCKFEYQEKVGRGSLGEGRIVDPSIFARVFELILQIRVMPKKGLIFMRDRTGWL